MPYIKEKDRGSLLPVLTNRYLKVNDTETGYEEGRVVGEFKAELFPKRKSPLKEDFDQAFEENPRGISPELTQEAKTEANYKNYLEIHECESLEARFVLNADQPQLIDYQQVTVPTGQVGALTLILEAKGEGPYYRNGLVEVDLPEDSQLDLILVHKVGPNTTNNLSLVANLADGALLKVTEVEMGEGKTNFHYSPDLLGYESTTNVSTAFLGHGQADFDLFYHIRFLGEYSTGHIEANGALTDQAKKSFRGTLNFEEGCIGASGDEAEFTILNSEEAKSLAVPELICKENEVTGNHASSAGRIDEDLLYYFLCRGIPEEEARNLIVEAKMIPTFDRIPDPELRRALKKEIRQRSLAHHEI